MAAQLLLLCGPTQPGLHWCARLVASEDAGVRAKEGFKIQGSIRIASDTSQKTPYSAKVTPTSNPVDPSKLGEPDARGGWTIRGKATIACPSVGHYPFALYGHAPGLRVLWAAVSCTAER